MDSRKRKASTSKSEVGSENSETNSRNKEKEISWIEKQTLPKGSSPVVWDSTYASSSDEEFEGFFNRDILLLSDVDESVTNTDVVAFFQDFECKVVSSVAGRKKRETVAVKFSSEKSAVAALKKCKDARLKGQTVSLTRSVNPMYKSFWVKGFKKNQQPNDIRHHINSKFGQFGTILHYYFPSEVTFCYIYMALKPEFTAKDVSAKGLQVRECQMKGKVTRSQLSQWTQERSN